MKTQVVDLNLTGDEALLVVAALGQQVAGLKLVLGTISTCKGDKPLYDKLVELQNAIEDRMLATEVIPTYTVGSNDCGYLPDAPPFITDSYETAKESLLCDLQGAADYVDSSEVEVTTDEAHQAAIDFLNSSFARGKEFCVIFNHRAYWASVQHMTRAEYEAEEAKQR